jgi:flavin reductase (DIM6/NTAB) family NADH-FMN oxidoreductase RutF
VFYEPRRRNHGLPHDPFKAIVAPRPIGWISSMSTTGEANLARTRSSTGVASDPPMEMFSPEGSVAFRAAMRAALRVHGM